MHFEGDQSLLTNEPYHVWKLIEIGQAATPDLLELLRDQSLTSIRYYERLTFTLHHIVPADSKERVATVGDVADYILVRIYGVDVGYRSYLEPASREQAISHWERVIKERSNSRR